MNKKDLIIFKLEKLKDKYKNNIEKKWNMRAISLAINSIKLYEGEIVSGEKLKKEIKGIGQNISKRIDEILDTGDLKELNELNESNELEKSEESLSNILLITGVGLVRAKKWLTLGLTNIDLIKDAINNKKIISTHHINIGIKYYEDLKHKIPRKEIDEIYIYINNIIKKIDEKLIFEICGSYRRKSLESGDIDILISHIDYYENISNTNFLEKIIKKLKNENFIIDSLTLKGDTKFMGICKLKNYVIARRIDIRMVNYKSYYTSLLYFTGNKNFNIYIRNKALQKNYSLNEYGLTDLNNNSVIFLKNEKEIFDILKIPYQEPYERIN